VAVGADDFGDPDLKGLREIHLPEPISYAPETIGWWIVGAVLLALIAVAAFLWVRQRKRSAYRRRALARLADVESSFAADRAALAAVPRLIKRAALDAWPRDAVAALSGSAWLAFLDKSYGATGFTEGPGRVLPGLAYGGAQLSDTEIRDLLALVRTWLRRHRV
jgi:hypothetical protein